jgi:phage shock protein PspC (stress-responsive transcriptional regulator)
MNETTSNPDTPSIPASEQTPDAVVRATPPADDPTPKADVTPKSDVPADSAPADSPARADQAPPSYTPPPAHTPPSYPYPGALPAGELPPQPTVAPPTGGTRRPVRLHRSRDERMIAGVCGGLAETLGVDAAILRLALVLATVLGVGAGVIVYVACWILIPKAPETVSTGAGTPSVEAPTDLLPVVRP